MSLYVRTSHLSISAKLKGVSIIDLKEIGQQLKEARLSKDMTLEEIAEKTKLRKEQVLAIEEGDLSKLPPGPYVKGFVKLYYKAVGLEFIENTVAPTIDVPVSPRIKSKQMKRSTLTIDFKGIIFFTAFLILISLAVYLTVAYFAAPRKTIEIPSGPTLIIDNELEKEEEAEEEQEEDFGHEEMIITLLMEGNTFNYIVSNQEKLEVIISFNGACWINTRVDGSTFKTGTFNEGEIVAEANEEFFIRAGNAANITITINGQEVEFSDHQGPKDAYIRLEKNGE